MALFQHKCMVTHPALWKKMVARAARQLPRKRARNGKPLRDRSLDGGDDLWSSTSNVEMVALMEHFWFFSFLWPQEGGKRLGRGKWCLKNRPANGNNFYVYIYKPWIFDSNRGTTCWFIGKLHPASWIVSSKGWRTTTLFLPSES